MKKYLIWLAILGVTEICISLYLSFWREHFYNAIVERNLDEFLLQTGIFTSVALFYCFVAGMAGYLTTLAAIKWREILNSRVLAAKPVKILNFPQRVQEDCKEYPLLFLQLVFGGVKSVLYIIVFTIALLIGFSWIFAAIIVVYSVIGTLITKYIANPLVKYNYDHQAAEATYRADLTQAKFGECIKIMLGMAKKEKHLSYFQNFYAQIGVVLPLLLAVPVYFTTDMSVGALMRFKGISGVIIENFSYGVLSFAIINRLLSCRARLKEIGVI